MSPRDALTVGALHAGDRATLRPTLRSRLPIRADTACHVAIARTGLHLMIPHAGEARSTLLRCERPGEPRPLAAVDLLPVAFAACAGGFLVCGADADGAPTTAWLDGEGRVGWRLEGPGVEHTRWPEPVRGPAARVMWQEAPDTLLVADVGPGGVARRRSVALGPGPVALASCEGDAWAVWRSGGDIRGVVTEEPEPRTFEIPGTEADLLAVGARPEGSTVIWNRRGEVWATEVRGALAAPRPARVLSLGEGRRPVGLEVVEPATPVVWARLFDDRDGEPPRADASDWSSVVGGPGRGSVGVSGTLHAVAAWGVRLVLVGAGEIVWLEPVAAVDRPGG